MDSWRYVEELEEGDVIFEPIEVRITHKGLTTRMLICEENIDEIVEHACSHLKERIEEIIKACNEV